MKINDLPLKARRLIVEMLAYPAKREYREEDMHDHAEDTKGERGYEEESEEESDEESERSLTEEEIKEEEDYVKAEEERVKFDAALEEEYGFGWAYFKERSEERDALGEIFHHPTAHPDYPRPLSRSRNMALQPWPLGSPRGITDYEELRLKVEVKPKVLEKMSEKERTTKLLQCFGMDSFQESSRIRKMNWAGCIAGTSNEWAALAYPILWKVSQHSLSLLCSKRIDED